MSVNGQKPALGREIAAVAGIFLALFLLACLVSYSLPLSAVAVSTDPAGSSELWTAHGGPGSPGPAPKMTASPNWGGAVGGVIADMVVSFLGISAFLLPLLILMLSLQGFSPAFTTRRLPLVLPGTSGLLLAASALAGLNGGELWTMFGNSYPRAGYLGDLLAGLGRRVLGGPGSLLFFLTLLTISLMLILEFSPYIFAQRLRAGGKRLWALSARPRSWLRGRAVELGAWLRVRLGWGRRPSDSSPPIPESRFPEVPPVNFFDHDRALLPEESEDESEAIIESGQEREGKDSAGKPSFQLQAPEGEVEYRLPSLALLERPASREQGPEREYYFAVSKQLEEKLADFNVVGKVVGISPGPVITTYEFAPAPGVKINRIVSLAEDLALGLKVESVRIAGSLPGKGAIGIEIPNPVRQVVPVRDILAHEIFQKTKSRLTIGLGMDVVGNPVVADLARMPHLLIAGATGSGKSVAVNTIICSILYNATPAEVRLLLVDPKRIELSCYENIPHLLHPVVVDPKLASRALQWAVREMERRYQLMEEARVKSLAGYNLEAAEKLPLIVIIIDELADLMMVSSREVEDSVARLAQMARAAGMHLILATQRPSVDVLTGLIKANFPTRMSFKVSSKIDSRTILDGSGAEHLLGAGDMLFMPPGTSKLQRIHGAYISEAEIAQIVSFLKEQGQTAEYDASVLELAGEDAAGEGGEEDGTLDEHYDRAVALVTETGQASISMVQRRLRVGYNRAAGMIETMEKEGIVGPADGAKGREVLVRKY